VITVSDAFWKFRGRLETTDTEDATASRRQQKLRQQLDEAFDIVTDFLTGAYRRHTKTKPLRDVDIMIVLRDTAYLSMHPREILTAVRDALAVYYGNARVCTDRRAVRVDFGVEHVDDLTGEVISFDVVPAFEEGDHYLIPDDTLGIWVPTNPKIHAELATTANKNFGEQWKPLVKMIKKWNQVHDSPIEPSFLIEVMALELITGAWTGSHAYEIRQFFASAADRIADGWPDPAHVGPDISDVLDADRAKMNRARTALRDAEAACTRAILLERQGQTGEALTEWRSLFGNLFPVA
jgi:Second Messenger Oligonucleotide or Dinucleotide Synthetase domain